MEGLTDFVKDNIVGIVIGGVITGSFIYFMTPSRPPPRYLPVDYQRPGTPPKPAMPNDNGGVNQENPGTHTQCVPGSTRTIHKDGFVNGRQVTWTIHQTCHSLHL
jgi:hypothetical protein